MASMLNRLSPNNVILDPQITDGFSQTESKNSSQHNQSKKAHRNGYVRLHQRRASTPPTQQHITT